MKILRLLKFAAALALAAPLPAAPTNLLLITVDDMSCDSVGVFGNPILGITPNIDQLAAEGLRFEHGHVTVAITGAVLQALDDVELENLKGADGRSFLPALKGETMEGWDAAFTHINSIASKRAYTMRAAATRDYRYIWNAWHDGETTFKNESLSGRSWKAMTGAAKTDTGIAARVEFYSKRVPEELYHTAEDPDCLKNLITDPEHAEKREEMKELLRQHRAESGDPA